MHEFLKLVTFSQPTGDAAFPDPMAQLTPQFLEVLQEEAVLVQKELQDGLEPVRAHARTLLWLDALTKLHSSALDDAVENDSAGQAAVWSRDLTGLEYALGMVLNIQPLFENTEDSEA